MNKSIRTYYKALLLLLVFSSNTAISFACSYSSFFHSLHHHQKSSTTAHQHADKNHKHDHSGNHHAASNDDGEQKENCCSTVVVHFQKAEKAISRNIDAPDASFIHFFSPDYILSYAHLFPLVLVQNLSVHQIRWRPPATIHDLRIVIQSFQI